MILVNDGCFQGLMKYASKIGWAGVAAGVISIITPLFFHVKLLEKQAVNRTQMTQIKLMFADDICFNPPNLRHSCSVFPDLLIILADLRKIFHRDTFHRNQSKFILIIY